jgi:hypothetical protein
MCLEKLVGRTASPISSLLIDGNKEEGREKLPF